MAAKFGNTWWGQAWLNALSNIDYENRIPRGATYARKGAVSSLKIKDNIIEAKVKGSRLTPYKVMMVLPKFQQEEIDKFVDRLLLSPALITELLMRKLSPRMAEIAEECGLKLFPSRWSDLKMNCNCPDWAVPCKHIAAVIYMMSREIDNNPFLVFEFHGIRLFEELKNRGVNLDSQISQVKPPQVRQLLKKGKAAKKKDDEAAAPAPAPAPDFTSLHSLADAVERMLPDRPPFYVSGNFKEVYLGELRRMAAAAQRFLAGKLHVQALLPVWPEGEPPVLTADSKASLTVDDNLDWKATLADFDHSDTLGFNHLVQGAMALKREFLPDYDPTVATLRQAAYAAVHLIANSQIKPEIVRLPDGSFKVVWQPMPTDAAVQRIVEAIAAAMPDGMVQSPSATGKRQHNLENQALLLISGLLTAMVQALSLASDDTDISRMFFKGYSYSFSGIGDTEIPGAIHVWCRSLIISEAQWWPVIYVADKGGDSDGDASGAFSVQIAVRSSDPELNGEVPLGMVLSSDRWTRDRFDVLQSVLRLSPVIPGLESYVNSGASEPVTFDDAAFASFITSVIPSMRMLGLKVYLPKSLQHLLRPKVSLRIMDKKIEPGMFTINDMFTYDWRIALGDELVDAATFNAMLRKAEGLIRFKKSYIYVSPDDLMKLRERMAAKAELSPIELFQAAISGEYESAPVELAEGVQRRIDELRTEKATALPAELKATMRPYQERGFSWLYRNMKIGFGSILADDMGLGKTLQAIALMLKVKEEKGLAKAKALVVAPVGLLYNWEAEIRRFAPTLSTAIYHGAARNLKATLNGAEVVLTSYGIARSDAAKLKKKEWKLLIIDEAQNIKNHKAAQTKAVNSINAECKIALSGTPVENRLSEYWSIMQFANKDYLGSLSDFTTSYVKPIQVFNDVHCADRLKKITAPFLMRRMKTDKQIISDLPDKVERDLYASLMPQQAALYEQTLKEAMAVIEGMGTDTPQQLFKRQGIILQMILALKQICDHPSLFLKDGSTEADISGKTQLLLDTLQPIIEANDKVLIFTQYRQMGEMLQKIIAEQLGERPLFYHGGCTVKERTDMVNKFQNSRSNHIFLLSLKAAGTGLNLTAANHVIHYDLWWNPAVESQATDRAYRIGQKRNVMVDRFITKGTFEERINEMINSKRHLAEMTVATGETWIGNLSNKELHELFTPA